MRGFIFSILFFLAFSPSVYGRQLLKELDFTQGEWVVVGVSLHNYALLPIQDEWSAFLIKDTAVFRMMKEDWVFEEKFQDYCEYHYALKFYRNGELVETLRANLLCNYISLGGLSYEFNETNLIKFKPAFKKVKWSRIRFKDLDILQTSVYKLDQIPGVYWYGDVKQYNFDGNFIVATDDLPWNSNRDSLVHALTLNLARTLMRDDFYVSVYCWYMSEDLERMNIRFHVYCNEDLFKQYKGEDVLARWRNHFSEQNFIQIVVIGLNQEDYYKAMRQN